MPFFNIITEIFFKKHNHLENIEALGKKVQRHNTYNDVFSLWHYSQEEVRSLVRYMKTYRSIMISKKIGLYAAEYMYDYIADQQDLSYFHNPLIIPIPISKQRHKERGFNQNHLWGKTLARHLNGRYHANILKKHREIKKQALIKKRTERFHNVRGSFSIPQKKSLSIKNKDIILIDDLTTTGATIQEAERILKKAGARNIIMLTLAH